MISRCRACYRAGEGNAKLMKKKKKKKSPGNELCEKPGDGIQASPGHPGEIFTHPPPKKMPPQCFSSFNSTASLDYSVFSNQAYILLISIQAYISGQTVGE